MRPCDPNRLDQDIYDHRPLPGRKAWRPNGDTRVAFVIYLYVEQFETMPPADAVFDRRFVQGIGRQRPHHLANAAFEYGNRVGIFRVLDLLDRSGLRASVAVNAGAARSYPPLVRQLRERGYEFLGHGEYASRMITSAMPVEQQRRTVTAALDTLEEATGARPSGWLSQDYGQSPELPQILADCGIRFLCDYGNDEEPYVTRTSPPLVSIPNQSEWNDVEMLVHRRVDTPDYAAAAMDAFDFLYADATAGTRMFGLHIHPWISGQPSRFRHVEEIVGHIARRDGVWNATAGEIASRFSQQERPDDE